MVVTFNILVNVLPTSLTDIIHMYIYTYTHTYAYKYKFYMHGIMLFLFCNLLFQLSSLWTSFSVHENIVKSLVL